MSDWADKAAEREQEMRDDALAERARQVEAQKGADSATDCAVCGEPILAERRAALPGVQTCVDCQADLERELNNVWRVS